MRTRTDLVPFLSTHLPLVLSKIIINLSSNLNLYLFKAFIERNIAHVYNNDENYDDDDYDDDNNNNNNKIQFFLKSYIMCNEISLSRFRSIILCENLLREQSTLAHTHVYIIYKIFIPNKAHIKIHTYI